MSNEKLRPETIAAHALKAVDEATGAVVPPIYTSTTYARDENYVPKLRENYVRNGNPTLWQAEDAIAALEHGKAALLFASGMAAITTLTETIPHGAHVVAPDVMYYGTRDWFQRLETLGRITLTLFDPQDPAALAEALIKGKTDLVWIETPLNPTWDVIDIAAETDRLSKSLEKLQKEIGGLQGRLGNPRFVANADPEVVDETRAQLAEKSDEAARLAEVIAKLEAMA